MSSSGNTTLSASGMVLPHSLYEAELAKRAFSTNEKNLAFIVTVASVVEPFLSLQHRLNKVKVTNIVDFFFPMKCKLIW